MANNETSRVEETNGVYTDEQGMSTNSESDQANKVMRIIMKILAIPLLVFIVAAGGFITVLAKLGGKVCVFIGGFFIILSIIMFVIGMFQGADFVEVFISCVAIFAIGMLIACIEYASDIVAGLTALASGRLMEFIKS